MPSERPVSAPTIQAFIDACRRAPAQARLESLLGRIVANASVHARFLNTLARLEYVGVRKMLKARRAEDIDLGGLAHVLEEAAHATRLKRFAHRVAPPHVSVAGFGDEHTLAGGAAEAYFQAVDRAAAESIAAQPQHTEACYALTSAAIEIRARCLYPAYQTTLKAAQSPVSVLSILADEEKHLSEMEAKLPGALPDWEQLLERVMREEALAFEALLAAWEHALVSVQAAEPPAPSTAAAASRATPRAR